MKKLLETTSTDRLFHSENRFHSKYKMADCGNTSINQSINRYMTIKQSINQSIEITTNKFRTKNQGQNFEDKPCRTLLLEGEDLNTVACCTEFTGGVLGIASILKFDKGKARRIAGHPDVPQRPVTAKGVLQLASIPVIAEIADVNFAVQGTGTSVTTSTSTAGHSCGKKRRTTHVKRTEKIFCPVDWSTLTVVLVSIGRNKYWTNNTQSIEKREKQHNTGSIDDSQEGEKIANENEKFGIYTTSEKNYARGPVATLLHFVGAFQTIQPIAKACSWKWLDAEIMAAPFQPNQPIRPFPMGVHAFHRPIWNGLWETLKYLADFQVFGTYLFVVFCFRF